jgi:hypothetical protein
MGEMRSVWAQKRQVGLMLRTQLPLRAPSGSTRCARSKAKIGLKCYVVSTGSRCSHLVQWGCTFEGARCECMGEIVARESSIVWTDLEGSIVIKFIF